LRAQTHQAAGLVPGRVGQFPTADPVNLGRPHKDGVAVPGAVATCWTGRVESAAVRDEIGSQFGVLVLADLVEGDRERSPLTDRVLEVGKDPESATVAGIPAQVELQVGLPVRRCLRTTREREHSDRRDHHCDDGAGPRPERANRSHMLPASAPCSPGPTSTTRGNGGRRRQPSSTPSGRRGQLLWCRSQRMWINA
jgi:hypothetical protein